jgi:DNA-binding transcriptional LysR family regulator
MRVPDANTALLIVGQSDMTALVPRRLAARWAELGRLKLFPAPYPSSPSRLSMLWHRAHGAHPAVAWLRQIVREVAATL